MNIIDFQPESHTELTDDSGEFMSQIGRIMIPRYNAWLSKFPHDQWAHRLEATNRLVDLYASHHANHTYGGNNLVLRVDDERTYIDQEIRRNNLALHAIDDGAYIDVYNSYSKYPTALTLAACKGEVGFIQELLKRGADINHPAGEVLGPGAPLFAAHYQDKHGATLELINIGADLTNKHDYNLARTLFDDCTEIVDLDENNRRELLQAVISMDQSVDSEWNDYEDTRRELYRVYADFDDVLQNIDEIFIYFDRFFAGCRRRALTQIAGSSGLRLEDDSCRPAM